MNQEVEKLQKQVSEIIANYFKHFVQSFFVVRSFKPNVKSYDVFISYSHRSDRDLARSLEGTLQTFGRKWYQVRGVRTYRDETNLAAEPDLWPTIEKAVRSSKCLVLLASPDSARSEWVPREVAAAIDAHGIKGTCIVQTEGVLPWTDKIPPEELFSRDDRAVDKSVWQAFYDAGFQPLVIDLRPFRALSDLERKKSMDYLSGVAAIAAKVLGKEKESLWGEYYRAQRLRNVFLGIVSLVLLCLAIALGFAVNSEREARQLAQMKTAESRLSLAQSKASEFAARSRVQFQDRPDLSIALAMHSLESMKDYGVITVDGEQALRGALAATQGEQVFCQPELVGQYWDETSAFDVSPDLNLVAVGTHAGVLCIYQRGIQSGLLLIEALQSFGADTLKEVRFSSTGEWLFTRTRGGYLRALNLSKTVLNPIKKKFSENNYAFDRIGSHDQVTDIVFDSARSKLLLYSRETNSIELWDIATFTDSARPVKSLKVEGEIVALGFSPGGRYIGALIRKGQTPKPLDFRLPAKNPESFQFSVQVWPVASGTPIKVDHVLQHVDWYFDDDFGLTSAWGVLRINDKADWIAVGVGVEDTHNPQKQMAAEVWKIGTDQSKLIQQYTGSCAPLSGSPYCAGETPLGWTRISDINISADGRWLYIVHDISIRLWDLNAVRLGHSHPITLTPPGIQRGGRKSVGVVRAATFSPDSKHFTTSDSNGVLSLWSLGEEPELGFSPAFQVFPRDPDFSSSETVGFSSDSTLVAIGGNNGGLRLCRIFDRCGSVEPSKTIAPLDEGQWISLITAPHKEWIAAVSESRRVHFFHDGNRSHPFYIADVTTASGRIPVATREYVIMSGTPGRQVAVVPSEDGRWAAAFEQQQYGFNQNLTLIKLSGTPRQVTLGPKELGCKNFTGVTFDPRGKFLLIWYGAASDQKCTSILYLPSTEANTIQPIQISQSATLGKGRVEFTLNGELAYVSGSGIYANSGLWKRMPDDTLTSLLLNNQQEAIDVLGVDPKAGWVIVRDSNSHVYTIEIDSAPVNPHRNSQDMGSYSSHVIAAFSPDGSWLILADAEEKSSELSVQLWKRGSFKSPHKEWRVPRLAGNPQIVFDEEGRHVLIGPKRLDVDSDDPPRSTKALLVNLQTNGVSASKLDVMLDDSNGSNILEIAFEFSPNGEWLATGERANLWQVSNGKRLLGNIEGYPFFSDDSKWLALVGDKGVRLLKLNDQNIDDRGIIGPSGTVGFSSGARSLLLLANGELQEYSLDVKAVIDKAVRYMGKNLSVDDWVREFPDNPYTKLFPEQPFHASYIDFLVRRGNQAKHEGNNDDVIVAFKEATQHAIESKSVHACKSVVEDGIRAGVSKTVLPAAEYAVKVLAKDARIRDIRGKVRAASGDFSGAIEDFEFFLNNNKTKEQDEITDRLNWISRLKHREVIPIEELDSRLALKRKFANLTLTWKRPETVSKSLKNTKNLDNK